MIEVEVRGKIRNFEKVLKEFKNKAKFIEEKDRFSLIYFRKESMIDRKAVKEEKVDFKLRITNKKPEIVLKYGLITGSESRKEILIPIEKEKFGEAVDLFKFLDWHKGVIMATKTYVFEYKGIEFALVANKTANYFEAEKLVHSDAESDKALEEINNACAEFHLMPFSEKEFYDMLESMNNAPGMLFDFNKEPFEKTKERFKEFF